MVRANAQSSRWKCWKRICTEAWMFADDTHHSNHGAEPMLNFDNQNPLSETAPTFGEPPKTIYAASKNEAWLAMVEQAAKAERCTLRTASSITALLTHRPPGETVECILMDFEPSTQSWSSIEQLLLSKGVQAPVVLVLDQNATMESSEAVARIAHVVAMNNMEIHEIIETIRDARRLSTLVAHQFDVLRCHRLYEGLPVRQRQIVDLVVDGAPNKQIATKLEVSVKTIERDRQKAYRQLNVRSTAEMTRVVILGSLHDVVFPTGKTR